MNILVIGGTYFCGRAFVEKAYKEHKISLLNRGNRSLDLPGGGTIQQYHADRHDAKKLADLGLPAFDAVVDFCAYEEGDIAGMLDALGNRVKQYVFISTCDVYPHVSGETFDENSPFDGRVYSGEEGAYISGKIALEKEIRRECRERRIRYTVFRPSFVYGPHNYAPREGMYFNWMKKTGQILLPTGADGSFQMVFSEDVARAILTCLGNEEAYDRAFNLTGAEIINYSMLETVLKTLTEPKPISVTLPVAEIRKKGVQLPFPLTYEETYLYAGESIRQLGFSYTPFREGMRQSYEWYCEWYAAEVLREVDRLFDENKVAEAEEYMLKEYDNSVKCQDRSLQLKLLNELIGYYRQTSEAEKIEGCVEQALKLAGEMELAGSVPYATTLLNCANAYRSIGRTEQSLAYYRMVRQIYEKHLSPNDMNYAGLENNISLLYQELGRFDEAKECQLRALQIVRANQAGFEIAVSYANLANTCVLLEQYEEAHDYAAEAVRRFRERNLYDAHYCAALSALGMCEYHWGQYRRAEKYFAMAMELVEGTLGRNLQYKKLRENRNISRDMAVKSGEPILDKDPSPEDRMPLTGCVAKSATAVTGRSAESREQHDDASPERAEAGAGSSRIANSSVAGSKAVEAPAGSGNSDGSSVAGSEGTGTPTGRPAESRAQNDPVSSERAEAGAGSGSIEDLSGAGSKAAESPAGSGNDEGASAAARSAPAGAPGAEESRDTVLRSGLDICRAFYETYGRKMIEEQFPEYAHKIAVGLVGEGSDCFGYDDATSRDHDWGPSFCMWLTDETYEAIGTKLQRAYEALPDEFKGFRRTMSARGKARRGVQKISDFYRYFVGTDDYSRIDFTRVEDYALAACTNGEVFTDEEGIFSDMRENLLKGYPEHVQFLKLAEDAAKVSQCGQYNNLRMLERGDAFTTHLMNAECCRHAMRLLHHLQNVYPPHDKWLKKSTLALEGGRKLLELMKNLITAKDALQMNKSGELLGEFLAGRMYAAHVISDVSYYLDEHTEELLMKADAASFTDEELVKKIARLEFEAFDKVKNEGGRAYCQNDWPTFSVMRKSQYMTWNRTMLLQYLYDFEREYKKGHNLITEKYGRMMESTAPDKYREMVGYFPQISAEKKAVIEQIVKIQMGMVEEFAKEHPKVATNARSLHTYEDNIVNTSYETYLRGEISTYSDKMLQLYGAYVVGCAASGINIARETIENTVKLYGYRDIAELEEHM